jgi:hypothetical protein
MSHLKPHQGALKNLKQEIPSSRRREYLTREKALELLKAWTGQDFGFDVQKWEEWIASSCSQIRKSKRKKPGERK